MTCFIYSWLPAGLSAQVIQREKGVMLSFMLLDFPRSFICNHLRQNHRMAEVGRELRVSGPALCSSSDTWSSLLWTVWVVDISRHGDSMPSLGNLPGVFLCLDGAQSILVCAHCLLSHHWTPLRSPWPLLYSLPSSIYYTLMGCNLSLLQTGQSHLSHSLFTGLWLMGKNWFFRGLIFFYFLMLVLLSFVLDEIFLINLGQIKNISFGLRDWLETVF